MSIELSSSYGAETSASHVRTRIAALAALAVTAAVLGWLARNIYYIATDSWVAPIQLSPDSDKVVQLRLQLSRQTSELARVEAEVARIDADVDAIDAAIAGLSTMRGESKQSMTWEAGVRGEELARLDRVVAHLQQQRELLGRLQDRQRDVTSEARDDLAAGLIDRDELRRQEQALDGLALQVSDNERQLEEAQLRRREADIARRAYRAELDGDGATSAGPALPRGRMPEVAAGDERETRLEIEMMKLASERRGLVAVRAAAADRLAKERELLDEIQARPLYRAMHTSTDVAFVPYDDLDGVAPGARVMACVWGLFSCHDVGRVTEILPGEVVTEDPWGDLARGQFIVLDLDEPGAIREKVLRVRGE
ncbi:MAG: hypothetical protein KC464_14910 [Myxococcales bacterium]|nr:hypothetical protein [Myxococcales bacterium]